MQVTNETSVVSLTPLGRNADLDDYYDIPWTVEQVTKSGWKRLGLQFPDTLLKDSVRIYQRLRTLLPDVEFYVMADTPHNPCCPDTTTAAHVTATALIHYGPACLSSAPIIPVLYVFGKGQLDVDDCVRAFSGKQGVLMSDVEYSWIAEKVADHLPDVTWSPPHRLVLPDSSPPAEELPNPQLPECILYIGPPSSALTALLITHADIPVWAYNPSSRECCLQTASSNALLKRRYFSMNRAKRANVFGLLITALSPSTIPLLTSLRNLLKKHEKKSYTISVGKLNPAKLANFLEVECWILLGCAHGTFFDEKDYYQPIVTPFEAQIALGEGQWGERYRLLADDIEKFEAPEEESLDGPSDALVEIGDRSLVEVARDQSAAAQFLYQRTWRGLDPSARDEDATNEPSVLEQGRSGIARGYQGT